MSNRTSMNYDEYVKKTQEKANAALVADGKTELTQAQVRAVMDGQIEVIKDFLMTEPEVAYKEEREVRHTGFGKYIVRHVEAEAGRQIGKRVVDIPEQYVPAFRPFGRAKVVKE